MRWWIALVCFSSVAQADDLVQRRSIRGRPVEATRESESLRQLREFEEAQFPRPALLGDERDLDGELPAPATGLGGSPRPPSVGPDAIPTELRSPEVRQSAAPQTAAIPWLDGLKLPDLPVRLDPRVIRYLEFYKSDRRGRAIMSGWLRMQSRWRPLMEEALRHAHLPLALVYVAMIESGYDPHDRSHAGAVGLWQFMPENSRIYGLRVDYWVDERKDPERSTEAVTRYLGDLKERFGGWPLALAAFNAGYGAVLRAMQKYNTNDYWELCRHEDGLPWDTVLYVPKAMAAAIVGENRARFGYEERGDAPFAYERVQVPSSMALAQAAHAAGASVDELKALNPELRRNRTPPEAWSLRVPRGGAARFAAAYESHREKVRPYVVRFGERLDEIARSVGLNTQNLRALNGVQESSEVTPGLTLIVPEGTHPPPPPSPCDVQIVAVPDKDATVPGRKRLFYRTLPEDGAREIAAFFKVKPTELAHWNHVDLDARLASNMVLQLWVTPDFDESKAALVDPARVRLTTTGSDEFFDLVESKRGRVRLAYTIKKGDDLKRVGRKFGLTVADLERINRFGAHHTDLRIGQKITVYREMSKAEKTAAACKITPGGISATTTATSTSTTTATSTSTTTNANDVNVNDDATDEPDEVRLPRPPPSDGRN
jgi:membrane-bound lytic murein transglycosylase D